MSLINTLLGDMIKAAIKWLKKLWFESKLKARFTMLEWKNKKDYYWDLNEDFEPVYKEYEPREPKSEAAKLGGAMRLTSKWRVSEEKYETEQEYLDSYRQTDL